MQVARERADAYCQQTLGYKASNMRFVQGHIELLDEAGISDESVDLVISNCVINLSPDKAQVLREAYRVLTPGGEMYFSDVYCDRRLPESVQKDEASGLFLLSQLPQSLSDEEIRKPAMYIFLIWNIKSISSEEAAMAQIASAGTHQSLI